MATDDPTYRECLERLEAKLQPARIRSTLAFAGLFQLTHEALKRAVLDGVKGFYGYIDVDGGVWVPEQGKDEYRRNVLALDAEHRPFPASLMWLQEADAITADEAARLGDIYNHRHELTHKLVRYIVDPYHEPDFELFIDALKILRKISRLWVEVDAGVGTFNDFEDLDLDDVTPMSIAILDLCIRAYGEGLEP